MGVTLDQRRADLIDQLQIYFGIDLVALQADAERYRAALQEIASMTFDPWTNGAKAGEIAQRAV